MIIKWAWLFTVGPFKGFDAFTFWPLPFIFVRPSAAEDKGLIEHELVHYREQRWVLTLPWFILYGLSKKFRLNAEVRAYKRQIEVGGITAGKAAGLLTKYGLGITYVDAIKLLKGDAAQVTQTA
jgi:hypothetical protein